MTAPGAGLSVREMGLAILSATVDHFTAAEQPLPPRQYVAPGSSESIAWDCEQLVVSVQGIGWGQATDQAPLSPKVAAQMSATAVRHVIYNVALVRCTPTEPENADTGIPSAAAIHAAGEVFFRDMGLMSQAMLTAAVLIRDTINRSALVQPGIVNPVGPAGAFHGIEATIAITGAVLT